MAVRCEKDGELWKVVEKAKDEGVGAGRDQLPAAGILAVAQYGPLQDAVWAKCRELAPPNVGSCITSGMYHADGRGCSAIVQRFNRDGTGTVWQVTAYDRTTWRADGISVTVHGPWQDNDDAEWERRLAGDRSRVLIVRHCWFTIGRGGKSRDCSGFGGAKFRFRMLDGGKEIESRDMWFGGVIPPAWRERIPDTAEMLEGFFPGPIA
jgi:hypothetical protein